MLRVNNKLWLISDTHFGHRNIVRFQQRPETHEFIMLSEWIKRVQDDDQILHLGDVWMRASNWRWAAIISRLPGEKFLIKGNHDHQASNAWYERAGFQIVEPFVHKEVAFTHCPISRQLIEYNPVYVPQAVLDGQYWHTNIHGHTHGNVFTPEHDGDVYADKRYVNVCVEHTELAPVQLGNVWN